MIIILEKSATKRDIDKAKEDLVDYIKYVVDVEKGTVAIGGKRHFEAETLLLKQGSKQADLWGGGIQTDTGEIDYEAIINIRPRDDNPSKDVLATKTRKIICDLLVKFKVWQG